MNLAKNWELHIDPGVLKILKRIPRHDAENILQVIKLLPVDPFFGDIQKMRGEDNAWRRRVGAYRVFFRLKAAERIILIFLGLINIL
mgnify:FL=1